MANDQRLVSEVESPAHRTGTGRLVTEEIVRSRAYEIYEGRGAEHGRELDDWLEAERELRSTENLS